MNHSTSPQGSAAAANSLAAHVSRRQFLRGLGTTALSTAAVGAEGVAAELAKANAERPQGPGAVGVTLLVNGERRSYTVEPRTTLLEALRIHSGMTGHKEACDRGTCGACTVLLDGTPVYACMILAIDVQGREITTIEGVSSSGLTPLQRAMAEHDGLQCGYCSPGFVMTLTALQKRNPQPTEADVRKACSGHVCRCGSYPRVFAAALAAAKNQAPVSHSGRKDPHALA